MTYDHCKNSFKSLVFSTGSFVTLKRASDDSKQRNLFFRCAVIIEDKSSIRPSLAAKQTGLSSSTFWVSPWFLLPASSVAVLFSADPPTFKHHIRLNQETPSLTQLLNEEAFSPLNHPCASGLPYRKASYNIHVGMQVSKYLFNVVQSTRCQKEHTITKNIAMHMCKKN